MLYRVGIFSDIDKKNIKLKLLKLVFQEMFVFGRKSFLALISFLIIKLLNGIIYLVAVNLFLPIQFGFFQVATSWMVIFTLVTSLGFDDAHLLIIAKTENQNKKFTMFFIIKFFLIIISTLTILIVLIIQIQKGNILNSQEQLRIIFLVYINTLFISLNNIYQLSFKGSLNIAKGQIPILISIVIGNAFSLVAILLFQNFLLYLIGNIISNVINLALYFVFGKNYNLQKIDYRIFKRYFSLAISFFIPTVLFQLQTSLGPILFLRHFDEALLGIYSVLLTFFLMIKAVEDSFCRLLAPNFKKLILSKDFDHLDNSIQLITKYLLILNGCFVVGGIVFGKYIVKYFFGNIYLENGLYFYYSCLLFFIGYSMLTPYVSLILSYEKMKVYLIIQSISFVFSLISWIYLVPLFDIIGIELGRWVAFIPNIIIIRIYAIKHLKRRTMNKYEIVHLLFLAMIIVTSFVIAFKNFQLVILMLLFGLIIVGYVIFLFLTKLIKTNDIKLISDIVNPKKMVNYIKTEISDKQE